MPLTVTPAGHGLGLIPGLPDQRDHRLRFAADAPTAPSVDLRGTGFLPAIWDQGALGSCTAHAVGAAYSFDLAKEKGEKDFLPSRLFLYYNARLLENSTDSDSGATVADAIKSLNRYGAPPETDWGYDPARYADKPPNTAYFDGLARVSVKYAQVAQTVPQMQACLSAGVPFAIGISVYPSFESDVVARTGEVPLPAPGEALLGGHCPLAVGYRLDGFWIVRNSWGPGWGDHGYCYLPQSYLTNTRLSGDFWTVQQISSPDPTPIPPGPAPADVDALLVAQAADWADHPHVWHKASTAAHAFKAWRAAKGL